MPFRRPDKADPADPPRRSTRRALKALFSRGRKATAEPARSRRSDFIVAGLGIALGLGCALFPWYIFFNQDKFGIRAVKFEGNSDQIRPMTMGSSGNRVGDGAEPDQFLPEQLDLFATGTVSSAEEEKPEVKLEPQAQEFPSPPVEYRMVYASVGRAMIADDSGMWVVQRGSLLPDNSKVAAIEKRGGTWVMVTSEKKIIQLSAE